MKDAEWQEKECRKYEKKEKSKHQMKLKILNYYSLFKKAKKIAPIILIMFCIFLLGGGTDLFFTVINGPENAGYMISPKTTGLSPVAMMMHMLGFCGILFIYWGGKELTKNPNDKIIKQSKRRLFVGINLIGVSFLGLEIALRLGNAAI
jgi:hypothetical protein